MTRWLGLILTLSMSGCAAAPLTQAAQPAARVHYVDLSGAPAPSLPPADAFALETAPPATDVPPPRADPAPGPFELADPEPIDPIPASLPAPQAVVAVEAESLETTNTPPAPAATQTYEVFKGEWLDDVLKRWLAREGRVLEYRALFRVPVTADAVLPATSLPEAVRLLLTPLWGTRAALVASEKPGSVLEVTSP